MAYAWTEIKVSAEKTLKPGDKVSASDVGGDDEFEALKAEGVIREQKYPEFIQAGETPKRALLRRASEAMEAAQQGVYEEHGNAIIGNHEEALASTPGGPKKDAAAPK